MHVPEDQVAKALATYIAGLNHLARIAQLTQELIESAKVSFYGEDNSEIEEVRRDAELLIEQHLTANKAVHQTGLEYRRALGIAKIG